LHLACRGCETRPAFREPKMSVRAVNSESAAGSRDSSPASSAVLVFGKPSFFRGGRRHVPRLGGIVEWFSRSVHGVLSPMPNDAKLGLVVGVSLVLVVAVFFFRKEAAGVDPAAATIVKPAPDLTPPPLPMGNGRAVQAKA